MTTAIPNRPAKLTLPARTLFYVGAAAAVALTPITPIYLLAAAAFMVAGFVPSLLPKK